MYPKQIIRKSLRNVPIVLILFLTAFFLFSELSGKIIIPEQRLMFLSLIFLLTIFYLIFNYLSKDEKIEQNDEGGIKSDLRNLRNVIKNTEEKNISFQRQTLEELNKLNQKIEVEQSNRFNLLSEDKEKLFSLIEENLRNRISEDFLNSIENEYGREIVSSARYSDLLEDLVELKSRLKFEIKKLSTKANVNLGIGSAITITALFILYATVIVDDISNFKDTYSLITHYIPRLSLVVFIEIFAFFFLKLYKSNLDNVKFYHNEIQWTALNWQTHEMRII